MAYGGIKTRVKAAASGAVPGQASDLTLSLDGISVLDSFYTKPTNSAYERLRVREVGARKWSAPLRLEASAVASLTLRSEADYEGQVQGTSSGGQRGAWSNTATFSTPNIEEGEDGETFSVDVRRNYVGGAGGSELYSHTLAAVAASVNEGSSVQWDYTLAKNGGSNEIYTIRFRTVQPSLPSGSYAQTIVDACQSVSEAGVTFVGDGTPTDLTFAIDAATFDGTLRISRLTTNITGNQGAVTSISNASPCVVTMAEAPGYASGQPVLFTTTGALPAPLAVDTTYYVINPSGTTFQLSATVGGAAINTTNAGSGTHRCHLMSGLMIEAVSAGTNNTPTGQLIKITDTFTAGPAEGALSYLTLSSDWLHSPDINTGIPVAVTGGTTVGTHRVGEILGWDDTDVAVTLTAASLTDTVGGRFKITQETTHFYLDVDSGGPIDFLTGINNRPINHYIPSITANDVGAVVATLAPLVRAKFPKVAPTGDGTATVLTQDDMTELLATLVAVGDDKTVQISAAWTGVANTTGQGDKKLRRSNATYIGHPLWAYRPQKGVYFQQGSNIIIKDWAFRVDGTAGLDSANGIDIDNLNLCYGNPTAMLRNVEFINCSFSTSNDELLRVKGEDGFQCQGIKFTRCLFARPLTASGNKKQFPTGSHNHGPAVSPGNMNIVFDRCVIMDFRTRGPRCNRSTGFTVRNCLIANWQNGTTLGGIMCAQGDVGSGTEIITARLEANLFDGMLAGERNAINLEHLNNVNTAYVYIPNSGNYQNTFINVATGLYDPDYVSLGDGINIHTGESAAYVSNAGVIRQTPPYELADDYGILPTSTAGEIEALANDILNYVGVRERVGGVHTGDLISGDDALNAFDYDVLHTYRTGGTGDRTYLPAEVDAQWGPDWNGGGTKGAGMADAAP